MKDRTDRILLAVFLVTAALYAFFLLSAPIVEIIPLWPDDPFRFSALRILLALGFHAVPCFCLQLLICRMVKRPILRLIPVFLLVGVAAAFFAAAMANSTDWDGLGWVLLLLLCFAPAVGYAAAWAVYAVRLAGEKASHKTNI